MIKKIATYKKYSLAELEAFPTIHQGQYADLKCEFSNMKIRIWLTRTGVDDGEPYDNKVVVECYITDKWVTVDEYEATNDIT